MHGIPRAQGCRAYSSVRRDVGAVCVERLAVFVPSLPHPLLSTVYQCDGCLSYLGRGGSCLGCQVWPAISAVSILELVANSGSSRMSRAPNLHSLRATKLFTEETHAYHTIRENLHHQLHHIYPGRVLDLKTKDLIGHLCVFFIIDHSECLVCFLFLH